LLRVCALVGLFGLLVLSACDRKLPSTGQPTPRADTASASQIKLAPDCTITFPDDYPTQVVDSPIGDLQVLSWSTGAWGGQDGAWVIERGGQGCYVENDHTKADSSKIASKTLFSVSVAEFDAIAAQVDYRTMTGHLVACEMVMSDTSTGTYGFYGANAQSVINWDRGFYCTGSRQFFATMRSLNKEISKLAGQDVKTPPTPVKF
jgi:hypothetical protein